MIISHEHRFIFVRTRKTAGTSIEILLSSLVGGDAVITSVSPRDEALRARWGGRAPQNHLDPSVPPAETGIVPPGPAPGVVFYNHMPAVDIREVVGARVWDRYFTFCIERNPWDKVVSLYYHRYRSDPRPGLAHFVRSGEAADCLNWPLYSENGVPIVDAIGQYERLDDELTILLRTCGLPAPVALPRAKAQFRPPGRQYRSEYDPDVRELVATIFATEIEYYGYKW